MCRVPLPCTDLGTESRCGHHPIAPCPPGQEPSPHLSSAGTRTCTESHHTCGHRGREHVACPTSSRCAAPGPLRCPPQHYICTGHSPSIHWWLLSPHTALTCPSHPLPHTLSSKATAGSLRKGLEAQKQSGDERFRWIRCTPICRKAQEPASQELRFCPRGSGDRHPALHPDMDLQSAARGASAAVLS